MSEQGSPASLGGPSGFPRLGLIWAQARGGVIGKDGVMPWHVPEDLAHFKAVTEGSAVVMGRKTWDSLPPRFRPLEGRRNIVITRQPDWSAEGADVAHTIENALALAASVTPEAGFVWVIGGAEIYRAVIEHASRLEVTEIDADFAGDTLAPGISPRWRSVSIDPESGWHSSRSGLDYRFIRYE